MKIALGTDDDAPVVDVIEALVRGAGHELVRLPRGAWGPVAIDVATRVARGDAERGIVCCWTGTGVSIAANKVSGARAALCVDATTARGARRWNDANVLALSLRLVSPAVAEEILEAFLATEYDATERVSLDAIAQAR